LFQVFEAKLSLGDRSDGRGKPNKCLFLNVDVAHKHLAARSLREFIDEMAREYEGPELKEKIEQYFTRKRAMISYSSSWVQIDHFNWEKSEKYEFDRKRQGKPPISIKDYLEESYQLDVEGGSMCTVVCRDGRGRQSNDYLPQHVYVTVSKEQTVDIDATIKDREAMDPGTRMSVINGFVKEFGKTQNKNFALEISTDPFSLQGLVIPEPRLTLNISGREQKENPQNFTRNWRNCSGFMNEPKEIRVGAIAHSSSRHSDQLKWDFQKYTRKRNIGDYASFTDCETFRNWTEADIEKALGRIRADLVICLIDEGKTGSEQKSMVSRLAGRYNLKTQFIRSSNLGGKPTPFYGAMDDVMAKLGAAWFNIDYGFSTLKSSDIWVLGVDVYKSQSESQLSGINIQLCTEISVGTLGNTVDRSSYLLMPKKNISPMLPFKQALTKLLGEARDRVGHGPKYLLMFRGGISMAELVIFRTNEVIAMIQAVNDVFPKKERPSTTSFVVPKGSRVRFSTTTNPVCVASTITGGFYQDFYTQVNVRHRKTPRIIQYATVHDDGFVKNLLTENPEDFLKLISGLCYLYPQSINFSNGPCSYPGPLKAAQNTSENFTQFVFESDKGLEELGELPNSFLADLARLSVRHTEDVEMGEN